MEWDGARGQWTNLSRADGFGPADGRPMAYDAVRKVVLALGAKPAGDGPWSWTADLGWKNLRAPGQIFDGPSRTNSAASVYDVGRDRWIVSGGYAETATWEWDGTVWHKSTAPPPGGTTTQLAGARLTYDTRRSVVYSVGNRDRGTRRGSTTLRRTLDRAAEHRPVAVAARMGRRGVRRTPRSRDGVRWLRPGHGGGSTLGDLAEWDPARVRGRPVRTRARRRLRA